MTAIDHEPPVRLRRRLLRLAQTGLYWTGATALYAGLSRSRSLLILMYHSVADDSHAGWIAPWNRISPRCFEAQMRFLARHRRVISLGALIDSIDHRRPIDRRAVVLTFDDGYRDNLEVAAPILQRYRLPAVLYLCTGYVSRGEPQWADVLHSAMQRRRRDRLAIDGGPSFDLEYARGRQAAYRDLHQRLLASDHAGRTELLNEIIAQLRPDARAPRQTLTWEEVRRLAEQYPNFELGIHTADHRDLSTMAVAEALAEVRRSAADFQRELRRPPEHFSFPYGGAVPEVSRRLGELGLRSAMATEGVGEWTNLDPLNLPRATAPRSHPRLRYLTSGAHPGLSLRLFGRA